MQCRDVREVADSFLSEELLTETNHEILRHLETCPACRADMASRRDLRAALRGAFERSELLKSSPDLASRVRANLHDTVLQGRSRRGLLERFTGTWWALAASMLLAIGAAGGFWAWYRISTDDLLARTAVGDHRNCALKFQLTEKPISLEEAAQRYDEAYRVLENVPAADITTKEATARVLERHSCVYDGRRFAHIVLRYRGAVVSLLVTATNSASPISIPAVVQSEGYERSVDRMQVISARSTHHAIFLVGDLPRADLASLGSTILAPVVNGLTGA